MSKITSEHLARAAYIYVRQSTAYQVVNNLESQRRQYGLVERARQLGWDDVQLVDDDLGRSGGGTARPGFEKLLAAICEGKVGAVVSLEASRLARNGRDWHTLLEFCGLVGTLIVDVIGIPMKPLECRHKGFVTATFPTELSLSSVEKSGRLCLSFWRPLYGYAQPSSPGFERSAGWGGGPWAASCTDRGRRRRSRDQCHQA